MDFIKNIKSFVKKDEIGEPPWEYDFLINLDEKEFPKYLKKIFKYRTGQDVDLTPPSEKEKSPFSKLQKYNTLPLLSQNRNLQSFNQKIQWLKLYDLSPLKTLCSDKVKSRDYVKEKIGEEYLKPVLQICNSFDEIDFNALPSAFVMKCNHGSKWQFMIDSKEHYLNDERSYNHTKQMMTGWLEQEFWVWAGFEMQYKGIEPKIIIEPLMRDENNSAPREIEVYCFNGEPKIFENVRYSQNRELSVYDENLECCDLVFHPDGNNLILNEPADYLVKQTVELSKTLSKDFKFVRVDWLIHKGKLYFNELTFTPYSGFIPFDKTWERRLGDWIKL